MAKNKPKTFVNQFLQYIYGHFSSYQLLLLSFFQPEVNKLVQGFVVACTA